jgi:Tfp pilus assembly protein PilV
MRGFSTSLTNMRGTSLLEVLVALLLTGVVTAAIFQTYLTQHQNYLVQDDISEIQQSARATLDQMSRQIRMAGFSLPQGVAPFTPGNSSSGPDTISVTYRTGTCEAALSADMASTVADMPSNDDLTCYTDGQWAYIYHPDSGGGEFFQISHVDVGGKKIQHSSDPLSKAYKKDALVIILDRVTFYVDQSDASNPRLMMRNLAMDPQVYAEGISDLQFHYRITNGSTVDQPVLIDDVRQIEIAVTGRSRHAGYGTINSGDYRFRTYESSVALRNLN